MSTSTQVLINPAAGGGRGEKIWRKLQPKLHELFGEIDWQYTSKDSIICNQVQQILTKRPQRLIVIGGDGTLNQALNGYYCHDEALSTTTRLAFLNAGCGGDFIRQFKQQTITSFLKNLSQDKSIKVDIGKIEHSGKPYYFINISSCGLSAEVAKKSSESRFLKRFGGTLNYLIHAVLSLCTYQSSRVSVSIDGASAQNYRLLLLCLANGRYFGGGMKVAPKANPSDKNLDLILFHDFNLFSALFKLPLIYLGRHLRLKQVKHVKLQSVRLESQSDKKILIEADGECVGTLPATISLLKQQLALIL